MIRKVVSAIIISLITTSASVAVPQVIFSGSVKCPMEFKGKIYFVGQGPEVGMELFESDGTLEGTRILKDIFIGFSSSIPLNNTGIIRSSYCIKGTNKFFFAADDGVHGQELFVSDGTASGTVLVKDIRVGTAPSNVCPIGIIPAGINGSDDILLFFANDNAGKSGIWRTDGTEAGTEFVVAMFYSNNWLNGSLVSCKTTLFNGKLFFVGYNTEVWKSDGTVNGTSKTKIRFIENLFEINNKLIFQGQTTVNYPLSAYNSLTDSNVTIGTVTGSGFGGPMNFASNGAYVVFMVQKTADNAPSVGRCEDLYSTDGMTVTKIKSFTNGSSNPAQYWGENRFWLANNKLYFNASEDAYTAQELWSTDGTEAGTQIVKDIWYGLKYASNPHYVVVKNDSLFFNARVEGKMYDILGVSNGTQNDYKIIDSSAIPFIPFATINNILVVTNDISLFAFDAAESSVRRNITKGALKSMAVKQYGNGLFIPPYCFVKLYTLQGKTVATIRNQTNVSKVVNRTWAQGIYKLEQTGIVHQSSGN